MSIVTGETKTSVVLSGVQCQDSQFEDRTTVPHGAVWLMRTLCFVGLCTSAYLAWTAFQAGDVYGCGGGEVFDCGHVLSSRWSKVAGIPVSVPAVALYASMTAILAFARPSIPRAMIPFTWGSVTFGCLAAGLAALWFIGLQVFVLEHLCAYCLVAHSCGIVLAGTMLWLRPLGKSTTSRVSLISVGAVALLITIQMMTPPPQTFEEQRFDEVAEAKAHDGGLKDDVFQSPGDVAESQENVFAAPADVFEPPSEIFAPPTEQPDENAGDPVASTLLLMLPSGIQTLVNMVSFQDASAATERKDSAADQSAQNTESSDKDPSVHTEEQPPEPRLVGVQGNKFRLNSREWPLLGKPDAKYIFVEMFDYTCPHCKNTHKAIEGAFDHFGEDLAVLALPVPLNRACNDAATSSGGQHASACEVARLAVAVWRIDPVKFRSFHDWLFQGSNSQNTTAARREAERLVGAEQLKKELGRPTADAYISKHVELYKRVGRGSVPKLMFPGATLTGEVSSSSTLCKTIERELAPK